MERSPANRKKWILHLILALAAMMLIAAVLLLLGGAGLSDRYDVEAEILSGYDPSAGAALTMEPDGTLTVRMTRPDIYWYGQRYGVLDEVYRKLEAADAAAMGFRIADGRLTVYARCRTVGLPLSYRAVCAVGWEDGALVLAPEKVWLGRRISLPKSRWPDLFEEPLRLSLDSLGASVTDVRTDPPAGRDPLLPVGPAFLRPGRAGGAAGFRRAGHGKQDRSLSSRTGGCRCPHGGGPFPMPL